VLAALFLWTVNVDLFSLHALYANRLVRCYLGASRRKRGWQERVRGPFLRKDGKEVWEWDGGRGGGAPTDADPTSIARREPTFTGFDPQDDLSLRSLQTVRLGRQQGDQKDGEPAPDYRGPYPLFNAALDLRAGSELAWQDCKADAFILTPDYCGGKTTGYARVTADADAHLTLGRAMAISGAAVDPNMGALPSPPLTALMTVFNTRLGWWMRNPASAASGWAGQGPGPSLYLLGELFGQTNAHSKYVHLSDGGHFENLGVYELIRRRCRYIVATDAGTDRHAASDNLANLLRLVRTDFGIGIDSASVPWLRTTGEHFPGSRRWRGERTTEAAARFRWLQEDG
jgi:hypothetical protein